MTEKIKTNRKLLDFISGENGTIKADVWPGARWDNVFNAAKEVSEILRVRVEYTFNGMIHSVDQDTDIGKLSKRFFNKDLPKKVNYE